MLRLSWFKSIDNNSYEWAKDVFEYHLCEYKESVPSSRPILASKPVAPNSFFPTLHVDHLQYLWHQLLNSNVRLFLSMGKTKQMHSKIHCSGGKEVIFALDSILLLIQFYRLTNTNFPSSPAWFMISLPSVVLWSLLNASSPSPSTYAQTSTWVWRLPHLVRPCAPRSGFMRALWNGIETLGDSVACI